MKPHCSDRGRRGLTITEVLVVIAALLLITTIVLPFLAASKKKASRISCVNCLKENYLGFRIWAGDYDDKFPTEVLTEKGGAMEAAEAGDIVRIIQVASNELSTPKILVCPEDSTKKGATNFSVGFDRDHISYFVGIDMTQSNPSSLFMGDDNLSVNGNQVKSGMLRLSTNAFATWTTGRHDYGGNVGLVDGNVSQLRFNDLQKIIVGTGVATNRLAIP